LAGTATQLARFGGAPVDRLRSVELRAERDDDIDAIRAIQAEAFRWLDQPDAMPMEAALVDALRADPDAWIPELSIVGTNGAGTVVGHVVCSRGRVGDEGHPVLGLGPIGVLPELQGDGIGSALVRESIKVANARQETLIALLGSPAYYGRFGFVTSTEHGIDPPGPAWAEYFQVLPLANHDPSITGTFTYAPAFG
jgi:putative acetyltransferase